jgi:hypothetical protein
MTSARPLHLLLLVLLPLAVACRGTRTRTDPTVRVFTSAGSELGVSTDYGVVFLGRTARSGYVELEARYGDGPSIEASAIEPVGGQLYTAETEIRLPSVPLTFVAPRPGERLLVSGRGDDGPWSAEVTVRGDERVYGILLDVPAAIEGRGDQVGAGVYWRAPGDPHDLRLVGLVSGRVRLVQDGREREFLAVVGPEDLWRLVVHRRDHNKRRPWVYREDIL